MKKAGLVLEGGANRGIFTAGVLDFLMEKEFYFPYVVGTSAGACNATGYVSHQKGRMRKCTIVTEKENSYVSLKNTLKTHTLLDMDMVFRKYPEEIFPFDFDAYFQSDIQCEMVVTNCITGRAEYLSEHSDPRRLMEICRASSSMPLVTKIVMVNGTPYLDGGLADSIPLIHSLKTGHSRNVVVLTRNEGYRKKEGRKRNRFYHAAYGKQYPNLVKCMENRAKSYNRIMDYIEKWEKEGKIFVIRPEMEPVARLERDTKKLEAFYQHGYDIMEEEFERMKWFLMQDKRGGRKDVI